MVRLLLSALILSIFLSTQPTCGCECDRRDYYNPSSIKVETLNATGVSSLFATLNGQLTLTDEASSVEVYFVWGTSQTIFPNETPRQIMTSSGQFSAEIKELLMIGNTYYFVARARVSADNTEQGEVKSFYIP